MGALLKKLSSVAGWCIFDPKCAKLEGPSGGGEDPCSCGISMTGAEGKSVVMLVERNIHHVVLVGVDIVSRIVLG